MFIVTLFVSFSFLKRELEDDFEDFDDLEDDDFDESEDLEEELEDLEEESEDFEDEDESLLESELDVFPEASACSFFSSDFAVCAFLTCSVTFVFSDFVSVEGYAIMTCTRHAIISAAAARIRTAIRISL